MNVELLLQELNVQKHLLALLLGMPRLFMIFMVAPFLGGTVLTGMLKTVIVFSCYLVLHPTVVAQITEIPDSGFHLLSLYGSILAKECLLGLLIGFIAGIVFWTIQSAGFFIDNQRGASMAAQTDPLAGEQTSPLGSFLFQAVVFLFFASGGFLAFLGVVYASYEFWPVAKILPLNVLHNMAFPLFFAAQVGRLMAVMLLLAGPIIVACLLTDISLGLINRFASQLNVYVLAMPIKSGVVALLLVFYFHALMTGAIPMFAGISTDIRTLQGFLQ